MDFDLMADSSTWADAARLARDVEDAGFSGMLFTETSQTPWMRIAAAASAAPSLTFTTGIAVAFPRSPMVTAATRMGAGREHRRPFPPGPRQPGEGPHRAAI